LKQKSIVFLTCSDLVIWKARDKLQQFYVVKLLDLFPDCGICVA